MTDDYNDILQNNIVETESTCLTCGNPATLKYMKIEMVEPEVVVTVFECKNCNIKETNFFNTNENAEEAVHIVCNFDSKDDLKRQINLNKNTTLTIQYQDLEYSFESSESNVYTVEGLIHQAIKNLSGEGNGFSTISDKGILNKSLDQLNQILNVPIFKLTIEDTVGLSRVGPVGVDIYKIQDKEIDFFNDTKVHHSSLYKRNEEI